MGLRPAWIQTSLHIGADWSESMLFAISFSTCNRNVSEQHGSWSDCADAQLVWIHAGCKPIMLVLSWCGSIKPVPRLAVVYICCLIMVCTVCYWVNTYYTPKNEVCGGVYRSHPVVGWSVGPDVLCIFLVRSITWKLMLGIQYNYI
jgi:hypothetical protein